MRDEHRAALLEAADQAPLLQPAMETLEHLVEGECRVYVGLRDASQLRACEQSRETMRR